MIHSIQFLIFLIEKKITSKILLTIMTNWRRRVTKESFFKDPLFTTTIGRTTNQNCLISSSFSQSLLFLLTFLSRSTGPEEMRGIR